MKYVTDGERRIKELEARVLELEAEVEWGRKVASALQTIGNELDLHGAEGPAGDAFRSCLRPMFEGLEAETKAEPMPVGEHPAVEKGKCELCGNSVP